MPRRSPRPDPELVSIQQAEADPAAADVPDRIRRALARGSAHIVTRAAGLVGEHGIEGLAADLLAAYARFRDEPAKDTGCYAKTAILEALDRVDHDDPTPFLEATTFEQLEKRGPTPPEDTAINVRVRGGLALVRLAYTDALLVLGRLLGDAHPHVRQAAAHGIAVHGDRRGAGLLLLQLTRGEPDPAALAAILRALVGLAPDFAIPLATKLLRDADLREVVAHALVESDHADAIALVIRGAEAALLADERAALLRALGLSRRDAPRELLLRTVAQAHRADALVAVRALAIHHYDRGLAARAREAAAQHPSAEVLAEVDARFAPRGEPNRE